MTATTVVNLRHEEYDVDCSRRGPLGNPFVIGRDGTREEVIEKHKAWFPTRPELVAMLPGLRGKRLGCYCKPLACHCDFIAELADGQPEALCVCDGSGHVRTESGPRPVRCPAHPAGASPPLPLRPCPPREFGQR